MQTLPQHVQTGWSGNLLSQQISIFCAFGTLASFILRICPQRTIRCLFVGIRQKLVELYPNLSISYSMLLYLQFHGRGLNPLKRIEQYNITDNAVVDVNVRFDGGKPMEMSDSSVRVETVLF